MEPTECIFLDDDEKNVLGARAVGMSAIHVKDDIIAALTELDETLRVGESAPTSAR